DYVLLSNNAGNEALERLRSAESIALMNEKVQGARAKTLLEIAVIEKSPLSEVRQAIDSKLDAAERYGSFAGSISDKLFDETKKSRQEVLDNFNPSISLLKKLKEKKAVDINYFLAAFELKKKIQGHDFALQDDPYSMVFQQYLLDGSLALNLHLINGSRLSGEEKAMQEGNARISYRSQLEAFFNDDLMNELALTVDEVQDTKTILESEFKSEDPDPLALPFLDMYYDFEEWTGVKELVKERIKERLEAAERLEAMAKGFYGWISGRQEKCFKAIEEEKTGNECNSIELSEFPAGDQWIERNPSVRALTQMQGIVNEKNRLPSREEIAAIRLQEAKDYDPLNGWKWGLPDISILKYANVALTYPALSAEALKGRDDVKKYFVDPIQKIKEDRESFLYAQLDLRWWVGGGIVLRLVPVQQALGFMLKSGARGGIESMVFAGRVLQLDKLFFKTRFGQQVLSEIAIGRTLPETTGILSQQAFKQLGRNALPAIGRKLIQSMPLIEGLGNGIAKTAGIPKSTAIKFWQYLDVKAPLLSRALGKASVITAKFDLLSWRYLVPAFDQRLTYAYPAADRLLINARTLAFDAVPDEQLLLKALARAERQGLVKSISLSGKNYRVFSSQIGDDVYAGLIDASMPEKSLIGLTRQEAKELVSGRLLRLNSKASLLDLERLSKMNSVLRVHAGTLWRNNALERELYDCLILQDEALKQLMKGMPAFTAVPVEAEAIAVEEAIAQPALEKLGLALAGEETVLTGNGVVFLNPRNQFIKSLGGRTSLIDSIASRLSAYCHQPLAACCLTPAAISFSKTLAEKAATSEAVAASISAVPKIIPLEVAFEGKVN
ncbi:hypothetical protein HZB89_00900, partial [archaeon]|nr:hypothetical protein [archaeon]